MALKDQIHIYSVDTTAFYTDEERVIDGRKSEINRKITMLEILEDSKKNKERRIERLNLSEGDIEDVYERYVTYGFSDTKKRYRKEISDLKVVLKDVMKVNNLKQITRELSKDFLKDKNIIAVFDSTLTRILKMKPRLEVYDDVIIVQVYYFEVLQDLVMNGFTLNGEKYAYYGSSAGQIKSKKAVFLKESKWVKFENGKEIWSKEGKALMCGLTFAEINKKSGDKGINPNKFNAYLSLNNSATDTFTSFGIENVIVVNDFETEVDGVVDFIDTENFIINHNTQMKVPINQMDGCGIVLPQVHDKAFMVRAPFIKGLIVPFDFKLFVEESGASPIVKDIYGKEYNILTDNIYCIMTKSQFKLSKYYKDWDDYKTRFKKNKCEISYAHEEEDRIKNSKINYQMLQSLSEMTDDEIDYVTHKSKESIHKIATDKDTIFRILGITKYNKNKNYLQRSIEAYPPLLTDSYTRKVIKQVKDKVVKDTRSGKVEINGKYLFMIPDLYAFCEHLFLGIEKPSGILGKGQVSCNMYNQNKIACLRAPHLYREWGIRENVNNDLTAKWFVSKGLYMSSHDLLSKLLMNDWDSDKSLIVADEKIIEIAERHMQGINPVYYDMPIATSSELSLSTRYKGLIDAYRGGGIGMYSNQITKIWNSDMKDGDLDLIRFLVAVNNFQIDYSKTLYKIEIPKHIKSKISEKTKAKSPYFFRYVKDKEDGQIEKPNSSVMNKICKKIPNPNIKFRDEQFGQFDYRMLMSCFDFDNSNVNNDILNDYIELSKDVKFSINENELENNIMPYALASIRESLQSKYDMADIIDNLIYYSFNYKPTDNKLVIWTAFGDLIYSNLINNLKSRKPCERCGVLIEVTSNKIKYCGECQKEVELERQREKWHKYKSKYRSAT